MQEYVAGFAFSDEGDRVALVLKNRPAWQAGRYNAVGGKIEEGETPAQAMRREFMEEAGVEADWQFRFVLTGEHFAVHFFSLFSTDIIERCLTLTDEPIDIHHTAFLPDNMINNLRWIIPMLLDSDLEVPSVFKERRSN